MKKMIDVIFNYYNKTLSFSCDLQDNIADLCIKYTLKEKLDINKLFFI